MPPQIRVAALFRRALAALGVSLLVAVAVFAVRPGVARADERCGVAFSGLRPYGVFVARGDVSCATARRALKTYFGSRRPCGGSSCLRRHGPWTCQTAASFALPRIASCRRGLAVVQAIAILD